MSEVLKMLEAAEFAQQAPLLELQLPLKSVFPTVLALAEEGLKRMSEEVRKYKDNIEQISISGKALRKAEKSYDITQKPAGQEIAKAEVETHTYLLVYFNPETKKAEVIEGKIILTYEDETQQAIEEALGRRSANAAFELVAAPMIREHIDERMLQEIIDRIKIESPSPFGGGAAVKVSYEGLSPKLLEQYGEQIIALEIAEKRKLTLEEKLAAQIKVVDEVVKQIENPSVQPRQALKALPPLSKARMLALFRKKRIQRRQLKELLLKDRMFLGALKKRLSAMRVGDILRAVLKMKK